MNGAISDFIYYQRAGYPYFYVRTSEMGRCIDLLRKAVDEYKNEQQEKPYTAVVWDMEGALDANGEQTVTADPVEVLDFLEKQCPAGTILILKNYNWFLKDDYGQPQKGIATFLQNRFSLFSKKKARKTLVIVSDVPMTDGVPAILVNDFMPIEFDLPGEQEIGAVIDRMSNAAANQIKDFGKPTSQERERLIDAAIGLTLQEVENALAFCIIKHRKFVAQVIDRIKAQQVEKIPGVKYVEYDITFDTLLGYDNVKPLVLNAVSHKNGKGVLLVGPPGTGKTTFAACVGAYTKKRMLLVELAEMQGGIVGDTERNYRDLIRIIRAMAGTQGVIVFFDELEKGLSGIGGAQTATSDSITSRAAGQLLKFMSDPGCRVYFMATCNNIKGIPPEWLRAERWDTSPIFVDLPNDNERKAILEMYKQKYNVKGKLAEKDTQGWSGAELKAVCRIADMMQTTVDKAKEYIIPVITVMKTMGNQYDELQRLKGACVPAATISKVKDLERSLDV